METNVDFFIVHSIFWLVMFVLLIILCLMLYKEIIKK